MILGLSGLGFNDVKSTTMGESGIDIQLSEKGREVFPYAVEAKSYARIAIYKWWAQCKINADKEELKPLLVVKQNRSEPLVVMSLPDFMEIINENNQSK